MAINFPYDCDTTTLSCPSSAASVSIEDQDQDYRLIPRMRYLLGWQVRVHAMGTSGSEARHRVFIGRSGGLVYKRLPLAINS